MALDPRKMMQAAEALDARRRAQIANQKASIERLLAELQLLRTQGAEGMEVEMGKRKDAFYAGFEAGETEDSVDEAWAEYKEGLATATDDEDGSEDSE